MVLIAAFGEFQNQVTCIGGFDGERNGFDIAHLADEDDIGIFTQRSA